MNQPLVKKVLDWRDFTFIDGALPDPDTDPGRLIVWLPDRSEDATGFWQRVATATGAEIVSEGGLSILQASSCLVQESARGLLGWLMRQFSKTSRDRGWFLPGGHRVDQVGERRTDQLLVWDEHQTSKEGFTGRVLDRWPSPATVRRVARNLYLVSDVTGTVGNSQDAPADPVASPRIQAEQAIGEARASGDRGAEAEALIELGILSLRQGDSNASVTTLEAALTLAELVDDRRRQVDAAIYLGAAYVAAGNLAQGLPCLERGLALAQALGDRVAETLAWERLATAHEARGERSQGFACFERARWLAHEIGNLGQEAIFLWAIAIRLEESGYREEALAAARDSVGLLQAAGDHRTAWYKEHLGKFERAGVGLSAVIHEALLGGTYDVVATASKAGSVSQGPGLLRMAVEATKAMSRFLGTGLQVADAAIVRSRLSICEKCEHHTGRRCRVCGCFTATKARLPREVCPVGKWDLIY